MPSISARKSRLAVLAAAASILGLALMPATADATHNPYCPYRDGNGSWFQNFTFNVVAPVTVDRAERADKDGDTLICQYTNGSSVLGKLKDDSSFYP
jgi:hypothetical protein